jgi:hypothetical protein
MIRFHCPSCNKLYVFKFLPIPDDGAEFLCARCDARCLLNHSNDKITAEPVEVKETSPSSDTGQIFDTHRPDEDEWLTTDELERRTKSLVKELPIGSEFLIGIISGPNQGVTIPVTTPETTIGKAGCDINLDDPNVSLQHCSIEFYGHDMIVARDLDSAWGTIRNGDPITLSVIHPGDTLVLGNTSLRLIQRNQAI